MTGHRGSPDFASLLLAQLDTATKEALLPCSAQRDTDWPLHTLTTHVTWTATACMARCVRHDKCSTFVFAPPRSDTNTRLLPGRLALPGEDDVYPVRLLNRERLPRPEPHTHAHRASFRPRGERHPAASTAHR